LKRNEHEKQFFARTALYKYRNTLLLLQRNSSAIRYFNNYKNACCIALLKQKNVFLKQPTSVRQMIGVSTVRTTSNSYCYVTCDVVWLTLSLCYQRCQPIRVSDVFLYIECCCTRYAICTGFTCLTAFSSGPQ